MFICNVLDKIHFELVVVLVVPSVLRIVLPAVILRHRNVENQLKKELYKINYINYWATGMAYTNGPLIFICYLFYVIYYFWMISSNTLYFKFLRILLFFKKHSNNEAV